MRYSNLNSLKARVFWELHRVPMKGHLKGNTTRLDFCSCNDGKENQRCQNPEPET